MANRKNVVVLLVSLFASTWGCGGYLDVGGSRGALINLDAPLTGKRGFPVNVTLTFQFPGTCGFATSFGVNVDQAARYVMFTYQMGVNGELCGPMVTRPDYVVFFTPTNIGAYQIWAEIHPSSAAVSNRFLEPRVTDKNGPPVWTSFSVNVTE